MSELVTARLTKTVRVAGGTLFEVAARELGSATQWTRIANLNGLRDPFLTEAVTLLIPPRNDGYDDGGILNG